VVATLLGKMLRIDVNTGDPYGIPADNPFVGAAGLDEIWAYGLRNPWRASFDRVTGDLYIGDVGQNALEEIDYVPSSSTGGENYGWRILEGDQCFNPDPCTEPPDYVPPVQVEGRCAGGASITGGYVYRGTCLTDYVGTYFYADYICDYVKTFDISGGAATNQQNITNNLEPGGLPPLTSFGEDAFGELYITAFDGRVYRIAVE
jgi:glucose/arabinose dehydrogenase